MLLPGYNWALFSFAFHIHCHNSTHHHDPIPQCNITCGFVLLRWFVGTCLLLHTVGIQIISPSREVVEWGGGKVQGGELCEGEIVGEV